jgi:nicotinamide-nucleotide amidase
MTQTNYLKALTDLLVARGLMIATAESCTAGLVSGLLTEEAGSSQWFERGFVTYSNLSKQQMLGVSEQTIQQHGAVSQQTVREMARGAIQQSEADVALSISGIAGPDGGSDDKPVGTVWFAWADRDGRELQQRKHFSGDRAAVREQAAQYAIQGMLEFLQSS